MQKTYPQTKTIQDLRPILEDPEVRGVVVASSAASHYSLSKEIMRAGSVFYLRSCLTNQRERTHHVV
jgi:predicted dehydrogenase